MSDSAYQKLETRFRRLTALSEAAGFLHWDSSAMMPSGGAASRAEQLATLNTLHHAQMCAPEVADWLAEAAAEAKELPPWDRANLAEMQRRHAHATALPERLVDALSRASSHCETIWRAARPKADFGLVAPALGELLYLVRESAAAKSAALGLPLYESLLDTYEPGGRTRQIDHLFSDLADFLPGFIQQALEVQASRPAPQAPSGPFAIDRQEALARQLMAALGFDFEHGRLDVSLHPFCGGTPDDVRITTRYDEGDFTQALMGVLHETGHALYELGLPKDRRGQPVAEARGMSIHESQSLLIEMQACRSRDFIGYMAPLAQRAFGGQGPAWEPENLYRLQVRVEPGFIRVDADEATYPAHVILRYRLERALIEGDMQVADIPAAWNRGMQDLLGITPPSDREGCLQDIHWYDGAWGYFPTYTLGALTAAQLFDAATRAVPEARAAIGRGDFAPLLGWLRTHVHGLASSVSAEEIVSRATGKPLGTEVFKAHLKRRYLDDR